ncbi:hypothetical protein PG994_009849 [Apiospora phragmitis]|uniref:Uncharacterized protein n=1 Tax=Apiospora phragmitis TaxID=2905665 RepID=A0ABR1TN79_9PEZI
MASLVLPQSPECLAYYLIYVRYILLISSRLLSSAPEAVNDFSVRYVLIQVQCGVSAVLHSVACYCMESAKAFSGPVRPPITCWIA